MLRITIAVIFLVSATIATGQYSAHGTIKDENGIALPGANIVLKGTDIGTATDEQGKFIIENLKKGIYIIQVSHIGYEEYSREIRITGDVVLDILMIEKFVLGEEIIVRSTRAGTETPVAVSDISHEKIAEQNLGHDLPYLLNHSVSVVTTSDAGAGVGYTGIRIRGTDANRINFTVNGIPVNDAESHGVWWVNMPDFASSLENIQIQRGVGTSTNGAGAFGATINMQTEKLNKDPYAEIFSSAGSFNTYRNTVKAGTGLLNNHFALDARLSKITSDGYIDRAFSDLKSFYVSGGYFSEKTLVKMNIFSGMEKTYQSWWGVPKVRLENDTEGMLRYLDHWLYTPAQYENMVNSDSRTYNYYTFENETDNYQQDHYQLFFARQITPRFNINLALHYTYGRGYYEQFRTDDDLADYGLQDIILNSDTITSTDLVRQKWLDNDFYGAVFSASYTTSRLKIDIGGGGNRYDGRHFGNIIWGKMLGDIAPNYEWYRNTGVKTDYNLYGKVNFSISPEIKFFTDLQYRFIEHDIKGIDDDNRDITQVHTFNFFNPKAGVKIIPDNHQEGYVFYGIGHREPNRSNFTDAPRDGNGPEAEELQDIELGYSYKSELFTTGVNFYYMLYNNQLILTGEINDVGSAIMVNVEKSYRRGIEIFGSIRPLKRIEWQGNLSLSQNKIINFNEYIDNWDTGDQTMIAHEKTDISFSPPIIFFSDLRFHLLKDLDLSFTTNYVGRQYIDNTSAMERSLDPYLVSNVRITYLLKLPFTEFVKFHLAVNNIMNEKFESNAWVYSYFLGGNRYEMDGYFPQAGTNFMAGINIRF